MSSKPAAAHAASAPTPQKGRLVGLVWRFRYIGSGVTAVILSAGLYLYLTTPPDLSDSVVLQQALKELEAGNAETVQSLVAPLVDKGYLDAGYPGGVEFVRGWLGTQQADGLPEADRQPALIAAAASFHTAEEIGIPETRQPQWHFAFGECLLKSGAIAEALPHLHEAVMHESSCKFPAALALIDAWLDLRDPELLKSADELSDTLAHDSKLSGALRDRIWLQRTRVLLRAARPKEAAEAFKHVAATAENTSPRAVVEAQLLLDTDPARALELVKPVAAEAEEDRRSAAQASYLCGRCAELIVRKTAKSQPDGIDEQSAFENAIAFYQKTAEEFATLPEALAARMDVADLLRELGRSEEALDAYGRALRGVQQPDRFRNPWLTLEQLQTRIMAAWEAWMAKKRYPEAAALADLMSPVVPKPLADDLFARAHQDWMAAVEAEFARLTYAVRKPRQAELRQRHRQCGDAWARSAESREKGVEEALAKSARHYIEGHEFDQAVKQLSRIIDIKPPHLVTTALLLRGQAWLDIDQPEKALEDFQQLLRDYPTDQNAFEARFHVGLCYVEQNKLDDAEATWRKFITAENIDPQSDEWRRSLWQLARLLFLRAEEDLRNTRGTPESPDTLVRREKAYTQVDEVIRRLEEYLDRYPRSAEVPRARAMLGRALLVSGGLFEERQRRAETDNARAELQRRREARIARALEQFQPLLSELLDRERRGELEEIEQELLRDVSFATAHSHFALGADPAAIEAYQVCVGRYQQDPETLVALVQMANCYRRLKQAGRVVSTLAQARLTLKQLPDAVFEQKPGSLSREDWTRWLDWAIQVHN